MYRRIKHSIRMILRNGKSYRLLSVTIVLSFSMLLLYFLFTDSSIYNEYKFIFSSPRNVVLLSENGSNTKSNVIKKMAKAEHILDGSYSYLSIPRKLKQFGDVYANVYFIPERTEKFFQGKMYSLKDDAAPILSVEPMKLLYGKTNFDLRCNEAIVNKTFYNLLGKSYEDFPVIIDIPAFEDYTQSMQLKIVGVCEDSEYDSQAFFQENGTVKASISIYTTISSMPRLQNDDEQIVFYTVLASKEPEKIVNYAKDVDLITHAVCTAQNESKIIILQGVKTKALIAIMILLILGINMLSCLSNVISKRKYEIGVERALGASSGNIIAQFFLESFIVMCINLLVAASLSAEIAIIFKLVLKLFYQKDWIIYLSKYSISMFIVCCLAEAVCFSVFLAYRATNVIIADELRSE